MKRTAPVSVPGVGGFTVIVTVSGVLAAPLKSVTTSENVSVVVAATVGAVNAVWAVVVLASVTAGPAVCVHAYEATLPSGSLLPVPTRVTVVLPMTDWSVPAKAVGATLGRGGFDLSLAWPPQADNSSPADTPDTTTTAP